MRFGISHNEVEKFLAGEKVFFGPLRSPYEILIETDPDSIKTEKVGLFGSYQIIRHNFENGKITVHFGIREIDIINFGSGMNVPFENPFEGKIDLEADANEVLFTENMVRRNIPKKETEKPDRVQTDDPRDCS
jgi:hypothetical protein